MHHDPRALTTCYTKTVILPEMCRMVCAVCYWYCAWCYTVLVGAIGAIQSMCETCVNESQYTHVKNTRGE